MADRSVRTPGSQRRLAWTAGLARAAGRLARLALEEDHARRDVTSVVALEPSARCTASIVARTAGVVAGLPVAAIVYRLYDRRVRVRLISRDGERVGPGAVLAEVRGPARSVLSCERTVLNFLQRLSGIATLTSRYVDAVRGTQAEIVDTRKTTPGWRLIEKYAVRCGGGVNHREHLADMVMFKDNHLALSGKTLDALVGDARRKFPGLPVAAEAETLAQVQELLSINVDVLMLDNMTPAMMRNAVRRAQGRAVLEATGGVTLRTVRAVAMTGVHRISVGALTHSAPALDISMDIGVDA
ncbi:carboxylating nicotinate-nucleotide diphosphorylase [bacterium]|nr:carboxylating nicotinate-nucleotide diphosphorylase [bacterium]